MSQSQVVRLGRETASRVSLMAELQTVWRTREKDKQPAMGSVLVQHLHKSKTIFSENACASTAATDIITELSVERTGKSMVKNNLFFSTMYSHQAFLIVSGRDTWLSQK